MCHAIYYGIGALIFLASGMLAELIWHEGALTWRSAISAVMLVSFPLCAVNWFFKDNGDWFYPIRILGCWGAGIGTGALAISFSLFLRAMFQA